MMETDTDALTDQHFNKRYCITKTNENWVLPPANELWTGNGWSDQTLLAMKDNLNSVKSLLNDKERGPWSEHTQSLNPAGSIIPNLKRRCKPELCTQAWAKCFEIMSNYEHDFFFELSFNQLNTIHLCEAPGAFITALNHFIYSRWPGKQKNWNWIATTLNPYYEGNSQSCMINDDRFILNTLDNWEFGADNTGDIMHVANLDRLESRARDLGEISLITADGSIGCHDNPSEQECLVSVLHFCEVVTALTVLKNDGHFVVKMFTFFESRSITLLYLLNCFFQEVHLFKPATSKEGNSEIYVICIGYEKDKLKPYENQLKLIFDSSYHDKILLKRQHIPQDFLHHVYASSKFFAEKQTAVIERNVFLYQNIDIVTRQYYDEIQSSCLTYYLRNFNVNFIEDNHFIVPRKLLKARSPDLFLKSMDVTFNALQKRKSMCFQEKVLEMNMELHGFMTEKWTPGDSVYTEIYLGHDYRPGFEGKLGLEFVKCGKPFDKVQSSRFGCQFLINLWNEAVEEKIVTEKCENPVNFISSFTSESNRKVGELILDISSSGNSDISKPELPNMKIVYLRDGLNTPKSSCVNVENVLWVEALIFIIVNVDITSDVYLIIENLVTRFTVGCFYILCHYFEKVSLLREASWPAHNHQIVIRACKRRLSNKNTLEFLQELKQKILTQETENSSTLEIVPVQQLICDEQFYNKLYDFNKLKLAQQLRLLFKEICNK